MENRGPAIRIDGVSFSYGESPALRDVSFDIPQGVLFGVLGPNGSGKTTLFRLISTLLRPDVGHVAVGGLDVVERSAAIRNRLGAVFQQPALDDELSILENVRTAAALYGMRRKDVRGRVAALAESFDLTARLDDRVGTLSGGLKRRADLIRGLIHSPDVLLLDEPTSALDPVARRAFWDHLARLRRSEGTTMIAATHLMDEAERCDVLAVLDLGRLVALDTPDELLRRLGGESIWLECADGTAVMNAIRARFGWDCRLVGRTVQIPHDDPYAVISALHESLGRMIDAATIRRPSLEDVFIELTGRRLQQDASSLEAVAEHSY
jgi:ABC-2 type transport system ATP-binding protein